MSLQREFSSQTRLLPYKSWHAAEALRRPPAPQGYLFKKLTDLSKITHVTRHKYQINTETWRLANAGLLERTLMTRVQD